MANFAQSFTTKELTFQRATGEDLTLTRQLCIDASDRTPVCVTGDQLRSLLTGSVLGASASSNDNPPPADAEPAAAEPADPINTNASSTPPASDEPPADQSSEPGPDVVLLTPEPTAESTQVPIFESIPAEPTATPTVGEPTTE